MNAVTHSLLIAITSVVGLAGCASSIVTDPTARVAGEGAVGYANTASTLAAKSSVGVVVNGEIITSYDIAQRARLLPLFGIKGGKSAATDQLIDDMLKAQEAKKRGLHLADQRVDGAFASMAKERKLNAKQLAQELGRMGIDANAMKSWIKAQMLWQQLVQARIRSEGQVKTSEIMSAMLEKGSPDNITMTEFRLQQIIFVAPSGSSSNYIAQRRREAERFRSRYQGCDSGLAQAKALTGVVVRDLGRRDTSQLRGAQADEIKTTEPGKTTRPFETKSGVELLAVCSKRDFQSNSAAIREVENQLKFEQAKDLGPDYLEELREAAIIQRR
jgi:peptidyl-prolyl cis-trans isomerase SurA